MCFSHPAEMNEIFLDVPLEVKIHGSLMGYFTYL